MLRIGPFNYEPLRGVDLWLSQTDEFILQHLSTTPDVEPPHFVMQVRATLKFIQENQFPGRNKFLTHVCDMINLIKFPLIHSNYGI
jgi:protein N-terminal asparagine amidohydrolase